MHHDVRVNLTAVRDSWRCCLDFGVFASLHLTTPSHVRIMPIRLLDAAHFSSLLRFGLFAAISDPCRLHKDLR